ncbi:MAG: hypothetical protein QGH26_05240 [Candidatus Pacebacteria bacterium]|nr:hypothetical protein [Candidatus Paceibacterota bacterium]
MFADEGKYVGEFKDGKQHGQGTYTHASGKKYVGEWKDGEFHGLFGLAAVLFPAEFSLSISARPFKSS